jgi:hypothetical protein
MSNSKKDDDAPDNTEPLFADRTAQARAHRSGTMSNDGRNKDEDREFPDNVEPLFKDRARPDFRVDKDGNVYDLFGLLKREQPKQEQGQQDQDQSQSTGNDIYKWHIEQLNNRFCCMTIRGKYVLYDKYMNEFLSVDSFVGKLKHLTAEVKTMTSLTNTKIKEEEVSRIYLRSPKRHNFDGLVFDPRSAPGQIVERRNRQFWNTWKGFAMQPVKGDCAPEMQYLREIVSNGKDDFFNFANNFFMHMVQKPWEKPEVALVLLGPKGVGKSFLMRSIIRPIVDGYDGPQRHYYKTANPERVFGRFTSQLDSIIALFLDELTWGGDKMHRGILQDLITDPTHDVEEKHIPVYTVANLMRVVIASDSDWAVPASKDERRYAVNYLSAAHQQDHPYYAGLDDHARKGGLAALMYEWTHGKLAGFDCRAAPQTSALLDQKLESMSDDEKWYHNLMQKLRIRFEVEESEALDADKTKFGEICVKNKVLYESYCSYMKTIGSKAKRLSETQFGLKLRQFLPKVVNGEPVMSEDGRRVVSILRDKRLNNVDRSHCSILPPGSVARELWDFRFKGKLDYTDNIDWELPEDDDF